MKPFFVLLLAFVISVLTMKIVFHNYEIAESTRIAMSAALAFTSIGHFAFTKGMTLMIPDFIPFKIGLVYLTGVIEIFGAIGLLLPNLRECTAWLLILFFILILPANINAAVKKIDYQKGTYDGNGPKYLWFRIPLQLLFIALTYFSSIKF